MPDIFDQIDLGEDAAGTDIFDRFSLTGPEGDIFDQFNLKAPDLISGEVTIEGRPALSKPAELRPQEGPISRALDRIAGRARWSLEHPIPTLLSPAGTALGFAGAALGVKSPQDKILERAAALKMGGLTDENALKRAADLETVAFKGIPSRGLKIPGTDVLLGPYKPFEKKEGEGLLPQLGKGLANAAVAFVDFATSPVGIMTLLTGGVGAPGAAAGVAKGLPAMEAADVALANQLAFNPVVANAHKVLMTGFAADMAKDQPERLLELGKAIQDKDWLKVAEAIPTEALTYTLTTKALGISPIKPFTRVDRGPAAVGETLRRIPTGAPGTPEAAEAGATAMRVYGRHLLERYGTPPQFRPLIPATRLYQDQTDQPLYEVPVTTPAGAPAAAAEAMQARVREAMAAGAAAPKTAADMAAQRAGLALERGREAVESPTANIYATEERIVQEGREPEYPGTPQRPAVPADVAEVRQVEGEQAGGGYRPVREPEAADVQAKVGEPVYPEAIERIWGVPREQAVFADALAEAMGPDIKARVLMAKGGAPEPGALRQLTPEYQQVLREAIATGSKNAEPFQEEAPRVTTEEDAEYMAAVKSGNLIRAQDMVDTAARQAGYEIGPVYHGTTHRFTVFNLGKTSAEGDWGRGHYFSNSSRDAEINYRTTGPDLTNRIESRTDAILQGMLDDKPETKYGTPEYRKMQSEARKQASNELRGTTRRVIKSYVNLRNPARVGGIDQTFFDLSIDEEGRESGSLPGFLQNLKNEAARYWEGDIDSIISDISNEALDNEGIGLSKIQDIWMKSEGALFLDEFGNTTGKQLLTDALRRTGFDGIVDSTVNRKFGTESKFRAMQGMDPNTVHVIAFEPQAIKSGEAVTYGPGGRPIPLSQRFDITKEDIRYQGQKGSVEFIEGGKALMRAFESSDVSTIAHEMWHVARRFLLDRSIPEAQRYGITDEHIQIAEDFAGVKDGVWTREAEEKTARAFERYLREGVAPSSKLQDLFDRFAEWLTKIYRTIVGSQIDIKITPEFRQVMDAVVTRGEKMGRVEPRGEKILYQDPVSETSGDGGLGTRMAYRTLDTERIARGLEPLARPESRMDSEQMDRAYSVMARDPNYATTLANDLLENPRAINDWENYILLFKKIDLTQEIMKSDRDAQNSFRDSQTNADAGHMADVADRRIGDLLAELDKIEQASNLSGSERGRALRSLKVMADEDWSEERLLVKIVHSAGRKKYSENPQRYVEEARSIAAAYREKSKELNKALSEKSKRLAEAEADLALERKKREAVEGKMPTRLVLEAAQRIVADIQTKAVSAREIIARAKRGEGPLTQPGEVEPSGMDPALIDQYAIIAAEYRTQGFDVREDFGQQMKSEFSELTEGDLDILWQRSGRVISDYGRKHTGTKKQADTATKAVTTGKARVETKDSVKARISRKLATKQDADLTHYVRKLMRILVDEGVRGRDTLIDEVHREISSIKPSVTRTEVMDMISGYGDYRELPKDETSQLIQQYRGEIQQVRKLIDLAETQAALKSGREMPEPGPEWRRLRKQVEAAKKLIPPTEEQTANTIKSTLESIKTRLRNEIADLDSQIEKRQKIVRNPRMQTYDEEALQLKAIRDERKRAFNILFPPEELTAEERLQNRIDSVKKSIEHIRSAIADGMVHPQKRTVDRPMEAELEGWLQQRDELIQLRSRMRRKPEEVRRAEALQRRLDKLDALIAERQRQIAAGDVAPKRAAAVQRPFFPELEKRRQMLDDLNSKIAELRKGPPLTEMERRLKLWSGYARRRIAELEEKIRSKDYASRPKRELVFDSATAAIGVELDAVKRRFMEARIKDELDRMTGAEKFFHNARETLNTWRAFMTSYDVSAVLRQGGISVITHPIRTLAIVPDMFRAMLSENEQRRINNNIVKRDNYPLYLRSGLYLAEHGMNLNRMEEAFMSRWSHKIWGVKASERAYTTFLNMLRADSFDMMSATLSKTGEPTLSEAKDISRYINIVTGRGPLGARGERAGEWLASVFFAPRFVASRFQFVTAYPLMSAWKNPRARALIASEYARFMAGVAAITLPAIISGAMRLDPGSSDFLQIRVGDTKLDPFAGLTKAMVWMYRSLRGLMRTLGIIGEDIGVLATDWRWQKHPDAKPYQNTRDLLVDFWQYKFSPAVGTTFDLISGYSPNGQAITAETALGRVVPITIKDVYQSLVANGVPQTMAITLLVYFGLGANTYPDRPKKEKRIPRPSRSRRREPQP